MYCVLYKPPPTTTEERGIGPGVFGRRNLGIMFTRTNPESIIWFLFSGCLENHGNFIQGATVTSRLWYRRLQPALHHLGIAPRFIIRFHLLHHPVPARPSGHPGQSVNPVARLPTADMPRIPTLGAAPRQHHLPNLCHLTQGFYASLRLVHSTSIVLDLYKLKNALEVKDFRVW